MADVFHALRNLGRPIGQALGRHHAQVTKQRDALEAQINPTPSQVPLSPTRQRVMGGTADSAAASARRPTDVS
jgi:hypothetical protein